MIKVEPVEEPPNFDELCRQRGKRWLEMNPGAKRPLDYWSEFRHELADGFSNRCGYGAMYISSGTVDHFISCNEDINLAYEWENYRYIEGWINSSKQKATSDSVLDPYDVEDGWFEIILPSLQMVVTENVPAEKRAKACYTLQRLHLIDDERIIRQRRAWYECYQRRELTLDGLAHFAPLLARAVRKAENAS